MYSIPQIYNSYIEKNTYTFLGVSAHSKILNTLHFQKLSCMLFETIVFELTETKLVKSAHKICTHLQRCLFLNTNLSNKHTHHIFMYHVLNFPIFSFSQLYDRYIFNLF